MRDLRKKFLLCGGIGWCMEIFWTGILAAARQEWKMIGQSSLWMFPIYGMAVLIGPVYTRIRNCAFYIRGLIYMAGIFIAEFLSGGLLKQFHLCPWDYSGARYNYKGLVRFDYAPVWFIAGLFYEKILKTKGVAKG